MIAGEQELIDVEFRWYEGVLLEYRKKITKYRWTECTIAEWTDWKEVPIFHDDSE